MSILYNHSLVSGQGVGDGVELGIQDRRRVLGGLDSVVPAGSDPVGLLSSVQYKL